MPAESDRASRYNKVVMRYYMKLHTLPLAERLRAEFKNCTRSQKIVNYKMVEQHLFITKRYFTHLNAKDRMRTQFFCDFIHCNVTCNVLETEKNIYLSYLLLVFNGLSMCYSTHLDSFHLISRFTFYRK